MEKISINELNSYLEYLDILKEYNYVIKTNKNTEIQINELKNNFNHVNIGNDQIITSLHDYDEAYDKIIKLNADKKYKMMQALNLRKNILECEQFYKIGCETINYYHDLLLEKKKILSTNIKILETDSYDQIIQEIENMSLILKKKENEKLEQFYKEKNLQSNCKYGVDRKKIPEPEPDDDMHYNLDSYHLF
ncbi:hypothetical protein Catovirus_1_1010 [Catovirus CTV1]|uniref:Uncharacterized protein n=1 Tax=Catovirus CTV1 TaxID=1977631 RepID=A0A1V0SB57_9VIRU|nr:hypothetical protein Catovirus_1_1010 [Catovirus CTV1]